MSNVEQESKEIIERILRWEKQSITAADQIKLTRWCVLRALISEQTCEPNFHAMEAITLSEFKDGDFPRHLAVWIGRCAGEKWGVSRMRRTALFLNEDQSNRRHEKSVDSQLVTLGFGGLFIIVYLSESTGPNEIERVRTLDAQLARIHISIGSVRWPPNQIFNDKTAFDLADTLLLAFGMAEVEEPGFPA